MSVSRIPALLARHRRLLALGLLSLLLHLLALTWIERRLALPPPSAGGAALAVRLAHVVAPESPAQSQAAPAPPAPSPEPLDEPPLLVPSAPTSASHAAAPSEVVADVAPDALPGRQGVAFRFRMPARYRVTPPPSVRLGYTVTGGSGDATLSWRSDGNRYDMEMNGILGQRSSTGRIDDAGVAPAQSTEEFGAGSVTTRFDRIAGTVQTGLDTEAQRLTEGSQDGASLLAQLAGMGLADPSQMRDVLEFWVAGADGVRIERYRVLGPERIATGAGEMETVRLARIGEAGERRLEIWLAPNLSWMPVQLRIQEPGGAARTQTLAAIGPAS